MDNAQKNAKDYYVVDMGHIIKAVWQRIWVVVFVSVLTTIIGFLIATFAITPTYSSSIMLYVNNSSFNVGDLGFSISSSELTAAQSLAKTYTVLLKNRTTLERLIDETGMQEYSWEEIYYMIESGPVNETEVMQVTVTCTRADHAARIASGIAKVLPQRVAEIVEGASMEVVDSAVVEHDKVAPSITAYTATGFFLGVILSVAVLMVLALMDNTVHDDDYVIKMYDYPILAKIPSLTAPTSKRYGYSARNYGSKGGDNNG